MKYMGWSYDQLMSCPDCYIPVLAELVRKEADAMKERHRRR